MKKPFILYNWLRTMEGEHGGGGGGVVVGGGGTGGLSRAIKV